MRRPLLAGCLILALANVASSQSEAPPDETLPPASIIPPTAPQGSDAKADPAKPDPPKADAPARADAAKKSESAADGLAQCLRDWDAATHMTRQEWARTCRRVVANRIKFQREQQGK